MAIHDWDPAASPVTLPLAAIYAAGRLNGWEYVLDVILSGQVIGPHLVLSRPTYARLHAHWTPSFTSVCLAIDTAPDAGLWSALKLEKRALMKHIAVNAHRSNCWLLRQEHRLCTTYARLLHTGYLSSTR